MLDVVLLVGRGRQRCRRWPDARASCSRGQCGRGHVRDHEARVDAGSRTRNGGSPDSVASISSAMRRSDSAPTSADRQRQRVGGEGHRLGVEVAAGEHFASSEPRRPREHQRIVGDTALASISSVTAPPADQVEAGAHDLWLATQDCTGPARGRRPRPDARHGSRCRRAVRGTACAVCDLARRVRALRACRGSKGASLPLAASTDIAPATTAASNTRSAMNRPCNAIAAETCVPLISASPSLAASIDRGDAGSAQRRRGRLHAPLDPHLALAEQREGQVRRVARGRPRRRPSPATECTADAARCAARAAVR